MWNCAYCKQRAASLNGQETCTCDGARKTDSVKKENLSYITIIGLLQDELKKLYEKYELNPHKSEQWRGKTKTKDVKIGASSSENDLLLIIAELREDTKILSDENRRLKLKLEEIGHQIMDEIKEGLQYVFQTRNRLTLAVSATGHAGMEAVMCNLIEPGDIVLVTVNGIWGERAADMAARYGAVVHKVEKPLGESFSISEIEQALRKFHPSLLFVVQGESSTGVFQRCCQLGPLCHKYGCLLAVDTVASLGGVQFYADRWEVDVVYTGSQKVLGAPPGLAPISFSPRAEAKIRGRRTPVKVFYLDMTLLGDYWGCFGNPRIYHHTVPVTLLYGLREGLAQLAEEGLQKYWERHKNCSIQLHEGITKLGLDFFVKDPTSRLPTVTAISLPPHIDGRAVSRYAMERYGLEIAGGLGPTVGKIMRIGLMGYNATPENVSLTLAVLKEALAHATASRL